MVQDTRVHVGDDAGFDGNNPYHDFREWLRPDLTALTGYTITSASLSFVQDYSNGDVLNPLPGNDYNTLELHDAGTDWTPSSDPSVISASVNPAALASTNVPADVHNASVTMDVTASTESWAGGAPEQGLSLLMPGANPNGVPGVETYPTSFQWTVTYVGSSRPNAPCTVAAPPQAQADPAITASPGTPEWVRQYAVSIRTSFALPATAEAVSAAAADSQATSTSLGTPLTQSEQQSYEATQAIVFNTSAVVDQASQDLPTEFAGAYYSYTPATMVLMLTQPSCPDAAELAKLAATAGVSVTPVIAPTATTYQRLTQLDQAITADFGSLEAAGVIITDEHLDVIGDRVLVTLSPSAAPSAAATMVTRYGAQGLMFAQPAEPSNAVSDRRNSPDPSEVAGGEDITSGSATRCSSNISAELQGNLYVVTAGHCFPNGTSVSQNGPAGEFATRLNDPALFQYDSSKSIGQAAGSAISPNARTSCDCELVGPISNSRATQNTLVDNNQNFYFTKVANSDKSYQMGMAACENGVSEYFMYKQIICGHITDSGGNRRIHDQAGNFDYVVQDAFVVTYVNGKSPIGGDSGTSVGHDAILLGVLSSSLGVASKARHLGNVIPGAAWFGVVKTP